jgi:hypothetical protein
MPIHRARALSAIALVAIGLVIFVGGSLTLALDAGIFYLGSVEGYCSPTRVYDVAAGTWRMLSVFAIVGGLTAVATGVVAITRPQLTRVFTIVLLLAIIGLMAAAVVFSQSPGYLLAPSRDIC